jgi:hypothetical protein
LTNPNSRILGTTDSAEKLVRQDVNFTDKSAHEYDRAVQIGVIVKEANLFDIRYCKE